MLYFSGLPAKAQYGGGTGEPNEPYLIYTAEQMNTIGAEPNDWDKHFKLMADIDLSGFDYDAALIAPDTDSSKGMFQGTPFTGVFDGNGHTISHLTVAGGGYLGLFGQLESGAEVKDLGIVDVNITGSGDYIGGLVGWNYQSAVTRCHSTGAISGGWYVGGLVGTNTGAVMQCHSSGQVSGDQTVGGVVGSNIGHVTGCYGTGAVSGGRYGYAGGLVGSNSGDVSHCCSTGTVSGNYSVGGLVGRNSGDVSYCYSTGSVSGDRCVSGLVGFPISAWPSDWGDVIDCFWNIESSGQATSAGGTGLTTAQMQNVQTYLDAGWDWVDEIKNGTSEIWQMPEGGGYPVLAILSGHSPPQLQGLGTPEDPYLISDAFELGVMIHYNPYAHYRLAASIDLSGTRWGTAVIPWFAGTFDGNGLTISHLTIEGWGHLGLFGRLVFEADVNNLGVVDVSIAGSGDYVGGLVGHISDGAVTRCYSTGVVSGSESVGGLGGYNNRGNVLNCYSTGAVSGDEHVGGLVGTGGDVTNCYSTGTVSGSEDVGGLVGYNLSAVTQCYSTGAVSGENSVGGLVGSGDPVRVSDSVWDMETSGLTGSSGGAGLTTAEMMDLEILGLNGFGGDPNWVLDSGRDYPRLVWEGIPGQMIPEPIIDWLDGSGTREDPFRIESADQLLLLHKSGLLWCKHFVLNADIDLDPNLPGRCVFGRAVIPTFKGSFFGNGHVILNLRVEGVDRLGLFGKLTQGSVVRDLGLENVSVHGTGQYVGGLVGENSGGYVLNSYSSGQVSGNERVGGLMGYNRGVVTECYSTVAVSGSEQYIGGLVGYNHGEVTYCFWDTQTSGRDTSAGGMGLTTAQMQMAGTFLEAGWDFVGETENGTEDIWWILKDQDYPRLRELPEGIWLRPLPAFSPEPQDGDTDVMPSSILHWASADPTVQHDIYFGEEKKAVANATTLSLGIYRGRQTGEATTHDPGTLEWGKTYYWRIDEYNTDATIGKGNVWSFKVVDFFVGIDDIEDYNDFEPYRIFDIWIDGYFDPANGSEVGYGNIDFVTGEHHVETTIVHGGRQSMPYFYDNTTAKYSEASLPLVWPRDWTQDGVGVLSLWFYGHAYNAAERMYVAIADSDGTPAVVYHDNPDALLVEDWTEWTIDLQEFAVQGVNLANVDTISIGFGDKNNPQAGGSGLVFFDDIRLYRPPEPEPAQ